MWSFVSMGERLTIQTSVKLLIFKAWFLYSEYMSKTNEISSLGSLFIYLICNSPHPYLLTRNQ